MVTAVTVLHIGEITVYLVYVTFCSGLNLGFSEARSRLQEVSSPLEVCGPCDVGSLIPRTELHVILQSVWAAAQCVRLSWRYLP